MRLPIYINGRFVVQKLSGVQRFAAEISKAMQQLSPDRVTILAPPGAPTHNKNIRVVGRRSGQVWEQFELPWHARKGLLINLGNTAPVTGRHQAIVIHDAGVFNTPEAYSKRFRLWYKFLHRALIKTNTKILTVSQFSRQEIIKHLRVPQERVFVLPEGTDHMEHIVSDPGILSKHGLSERRFVLAVGTLAAHKNLAALSALVAQLPERGMVLAVTGAVGSAVFQKIGDDRLPHGAVYLGRVSDAELKALYIAAACFVMPSLYEGFGLPAVEAMMCGCPVVAADIPALRETCGDYAIYADPHSPEDIAACVSTLLDDELLNAKMRKEAKAYVAPLTWLRAATVLRQIVDDT